MDTNLSFFDQKPFSIDKAKPESIERTQEMQKGRRPPGPALSAYILTNNAKLLNLCLAAA